MKPVVILVAGDPVPEVERSRGSFARLIEEVAPAGVRWAAVDPRSGAALPEPDEVAAMVITGSSSSVTERAPWMLRVESWLRRAVGEGVPVLGICFGHQLLGQALGGEVRRNPRGREIGTVPAWRLEQDPLFEEAPSEFPVNMSHVDSVVSLPPGARVVLRTEREPHAALRFGPSAWGVQFHPEFDAEVMRGYLDARREQLVEEGLDADALHAGVRDAPSAARVVGRFLQATGAR